MSLTMTRSCTVTRSIEIMRAFVRLQQTASAFGDPARKLTAEAELWPSLHARV
jgi:hypothetical protein